MVLSAWTVRDDVTDPNNGTNVSVTPQASMTEYQDLAQIWCSVAVAGELQAAAGASGTKSATASSGSVWTNTTIALRDANPVAPGAGPRELVIPSRVAVLRAANF